jgi:hypothetical protein
VGSIEGTFKNSRCLSVFNKNGFTISGGGVIRQSDGIPTGEKYSVFEFRNCFDFLVKGLSVDGNRENRVPAEDSGHLIRVIGGGRGTFRNVSAFNGTTDGWYIRASSGKDISSYPIDMRFEGCIGHNCFRNNMSIIGAIRPVVLGGSYTGAIGAAPEAGIGVEPNSTDLYGVTGADISGVECSRNNGYGAYASASKGSVISRLRIAVAGSENGAGLVEIGRANDIEVNADVGQHSGHLTRSQGIVQIGTAAVNVDVTIYARDILCTGEGSVFLARHGSVGVKLLRAVIEGSRLSCVSDSTSGASLRYINLTDIDCGDRPAIVLNGNNTFASEVRIDRCSGAGIMISGPDISLEHFAVSDCSLTALHIELGGKNATLRYGLIQRTVVNGEASRSGILAEVEPAVLFDVKVGIGYPE